MPNNKFRKKKNNVQLKNRGGNLHDSSKTAVILLAPGLIIMSFVILYPLLRAFILSFYNRELTKPNQNSFVLFENFQRLLHDDTFWTTVKNTFTFTLTTVFISVIIALVIAIALDQLPKKFSGLRGLILIPWVIPGIVVGFLFLYMFDYDVGIINFFLQRLGVIEEYVPWLMDGNLAMIAIIVAHVWNQIPFHTLMIAAGLKTVPRDLQEAAFAEGANRWQEFWHVTLPNIKGILVISSLLMLIRNFNNFPIIFTMTGGGPGESTLTSVLHIYKLAFEKFQLSYASAVGMIWVVVLLVMSIVYIRLLQKEY
ncbi:carbohydrate ABC transporter permease [Virgibacillus ndiopensis]|uniref:carbohydrate ABC transporter permease n=1 Tax=Virgibacillus ndiopensis TaxID=2004408 RepID=UPI000C070F5C|nr:sugar ABC transporter permease [Virgibacillus ndiopensis]